VVAGALIRKETIFLSHIIGMIFIIIGVWGVNYFNYRFSKQK
jgi:drug/metabolite transporter (DMT)-like permease